MFLIGVGLYLIFGPKHIDRPGMMMVEAVITRLDRVWSSSDDGPSTVSVFPVYEYEIDGKRYRCRSTSSISMFSEKKYAVGRKEMAAVDPEKPGRAYTRGEKKSLVFLGVVLLGMGLLTIVPLVFM